MGFKNYYFTKHVLKCVSQRKLFLNTLNSKYHSPSRKITDIDKSKMPLAV